MYPDPITQLVSQLRDASQPAAPADDSAVRRATFPAQSTIGPAPQRARVAPDTFSGYADVLASLWNGVANGLAERRQNGLHPADYVALASLTLPGVGGVLRAIAPAAEAAPAIDAELSARQLYSSLPSIVQAGGVGGAAVRDRAMASLMSALPKAAKAAGPIDDWTALVNPPPADAYAGIRPAAESMAIPAKLGAPPVSDAALNARFRSVLNATTEAGKYKPDAAAQAAAEMQRRGYSLFQQ